MKRQSCDELSNSANSQAGVYLAYASPHGATFLDHPLYLPQEWVDNPAFVARRDRGRIPDDVAFQTQNDLALAMIQAVLASQTLRYRWLLDDEAFGRDTDLLNTVATFGLWSMVEVSLDTIHCLVGGWCGGYHAAAAVSHGAGPRLEPLV